MMRNKYSDVAVIVPAYNEERVIVSVINKLTAVFDNVICVNDGSKDNTSKELKKTKAKILSHLFNIGQGGALETGTRYALQDKSLKYFITFDADGQHQLKDVEPMIAEIKKGKVDILLGSRFLKKGSNTPLTKRIVLKVATLFTNLTIGIKLTDSHNGLRAFNRSFAEKINLKNLGMAHASEFLEIIKKYNFRYKESPVLIEYSDYSKRKGQPMINAINIIFDILIKNKDQ